MQKHIAIKLKEEIKKTADKFSDKNREYNRNGETFMVHKEFILSARSAAVVYKKHPTNKFALFCFLWVGPLDNVDKGWWTCFAVGASHMLGLHKLDQLLQEVEQHNYQQNFT